MKYNIPEIGEINIKTIVLDLNGTLADYGIIKQSTKKLLEKLKDKGFKLVLISGDIRGNAAGMAAELGLELYRGKNSTEKASKTKMFDKETTAAIGNARIDIGTFENAKISVATIRKEGIHTGILKYVDIVVFDIDDALNLFLNPKALEGTLRL
jgi:soluble P-type ATPase